MNTTDKMLADAERKKEAFEYEMTEVYLKLKGEYSNLRKKDMAFKYEPDVPSIRVPDAESIQEVEMGDLPKIGKTVSHGAFDDALPTENIKVSVSVNIPNIGIGFGFTPPKTKVSVSCNPTHTKGIGSKTLEPFGKQSLRQISLPGSLTEMLARTKKNPLPKSSFKEIDLSGSKTCINIKEHTLKDSLAGLESFVSVSMKNVPAKEFSALKGMMFSAQKQSDIRAVNIVKLSTLDRSGLLFGFENIPISALGKVKTEVPAIKGSFKLSEIPFATAGVKIKLPVQNGRELSVEEVDTDLSKFKAPIPEKPVVPNKEAFIVKLAALDCKVKFAVMTEEVPEIVIEKPDTSALKYPTVPEFPDFTSDMSEIVSAVLAEIRS
jgi:hypothetical protein